MTLEFLLHPNNKSIDTWTNRNHQPQIGGHVTLHDGKKYKVAGVHEDAKHPGHLEVTVWPSVSPTEGK